MTIACIRVYDSETTGMAPPAGLVEVATVDLLVFPGPITRRGRMWTSLINPCAPIPPEASGIHDITEDMVKDAPSFGDVVDEVTRGAAVGEPGPTHFAAHNAKFDRQWFDPPGAVWLDTYKISCMMWPDAPNHKLGTLFYYLRLRLADDTGPRHRALSDAYVTAALLRRALATATIEDMVEVSKQPAVLPRIQFGKNAGKRFSEIDQGYLEWMVNQKDMNEDAVHTAFIELQRRREAGNGT